MGLVSRFYKIAAVLLLAAVLIPPVSAQEPKRGETVTDRGRPELDPLGIRLGSFLLYPKLTLSQSYDDNIYSTDDSEESDLITIVSPSFQLISNWNNHELAISAGADIGRYWDNGDEDFEDYSLKAEGIVDITRRAKFSGSLDYARLHEDRGSPDDPGAIAEPTEYSLIDGRVAFTQRFNRLSLSVGGIFKQYDYDDVSKVGGGSINNDDRDRDESEVYVRVGYLILPDTRYEAFVLASYNDRDYDAAVDDAPSSVNRDSSGYEIVGGLRIELARKIFGDVFAGYRSQDYDDGLLDTISGPSFGAALTWNATGLTTAKLDIKRTIEETTQIGASGYFATSIGLSVDHELLRNLLIGAKANYAVNDYEGISRQDDHYGGHLYGKYMLHRNFYATLTYDYRQRDSNLSGDDFTKNLIMLKLEAQL